MSTMTSVDKDSGLTTTTTDSVEEQKYERDTKVYFNSNYKPLYPEIYKFDEKFLDPTFCKVCKQAKELHEEYFPKLMIAIHQLEELDQQLKEQFENDQQENNQLKEQQLKEQFENEFLTIKKEYYFKKRELLSELLTEEIPQVFSLKIFTSEYCNLLLKEREHYEKTQEVKLRPNSMNNYGIVIDEMGMGNFFDVFIKDYVSSLGKIMNPAGFDLDDHHTFLVEYFIGGDKDLGVHTDDSELTLNICLGHKEKPLTYNQYFEYKHVVGKAVMHDGDLMHGAHPLEKGERVNLIIWCRSNSYRKLVAEALKEQELHGCCSCEHHHHHSEQDHHHECTEEECSEHHHDCNDENCKEH
ncbi:hypothetical protein ABK040_001056 [Willaertia magna]